MYQMDQDKSHFIDAVERNRRNLFQRNRESQLYYTHATFNRLKVALIRMDKNIPV